MMKLLRPPQRCVVRSVTVTSVYKKHVERRAPVGAFSHWCLAILLVSVWHLDIFILVFLKRHFSYLYKKKEKKKKEELESQSGMCKQLVSIVFSSGFLSDLDMRSVRIKFYGLGFGSWLDQNLIKYDHNLGKRRKYLFRNDPKDLALSYPSNTFAEPANQSDG